MADGAHVRQHGGALQGFAVRGMDGRPAQMRPAANLGRIDLAHGRRVQHPGGRPAVLDHGDGHHPPGPALDEGDGAVDGIDHEGAAGGEARAVVGGLLRQPAIVRPGAQQPLLQQAVDGDVGAGDRRASGLGPGLDPAGLEESERRLARLERRVADQLEVGGHLPAMARSGIRIDGALWAPRNSRSEPGISRA